MLAQRRAQLAHRITQPALRRFHRDTGDAADILQRQAALLVQHEHVALFRRQLIQRASEIRSQLRLGKRRIGTLVTRRRRQLVRQCVDILRGALLRPAAAAEIIDRAVVRDVEQERIELRPRLVATRGWRSLCSTPPETDRWRLRAAAQALQITIQRAPCAARRASRTRARRRPDNASMSVASSGAEPTARRRRTGAQSPDRSRDRLRARSR